MNLIKGLNIDTNDIPESGGIKTFRISGDNNAAFILIVSNNSGEYYNFNDNTFSTGHNSQKMLREKITGDSYQGFISFPSVSGKNYDILLLADPSDETKINRKQAINKRIKQLGNVTVTIGLRTIDHATNYATLPSNVTSTGSLADAGTSVASIDWLIENANTDGGGFGLMVNREISKVDTDLHDRLWYFEKTQTLDGAVSSSTSLVLDSVDRISAGMVLYSGTGVTRSVVQSVNSTTKTVVVSSAQTISDGVTLTFRAEGLGVINASLGSNFSANGLRVISFTSPSTTVRGTISNSTTINVNGTYGIGGGNVVQYTGAGVNNSSANTVASVTASSSAGSFVSTLAQTLKDKTSLTFSVASPKVLVDNLTIQGEIVISQYPDEDTTIYLDLDNFIDPLLDS